MADYAAVFPGSPAKATFAAVMFSDNIDIRVELQFVAAQTGGIVSDGTASRYFRFASNSLRFRSSTTTYATWPFTPTLLQDYVLEVEGRPAGVELFVDTVSQGVKSGTFGSWLVDTLAMYNTSNFSNVIIKRIKITDNTTPANSRDWFNNVSAGPNVTWKDQSANAQDATLVGTVVDGSQWALIGGGDGVTANGDITLPSLVFSGSATDSTSEVTANGNITLPSLVFRGSAGEAPEVTPDFTIRIDDSIKTVQTTLNNFTIRV